MTRHPIILYNYIMVENLTENALNLRMAHHDRGKLSTEAASLLTKHSPQSLIRYQQDRNEARSQLQLLAESQKSQETSTKDISNLEEERARLQQELKAARTEARERQTQQDLLNGTMSINSLMDLSLDDGKKAKLAQILKLARKTITMSPETAETTAIKIESKLKTTAEQIKKRTQALTDLTGDITETSSEIKRKTIQALRQFRNRSERAAKIFGEKIICTERNLLIKQQYISISRRTHEDAIISRNKAILQVLDKLAEEQQVCQRLIDITQHISPEILAVKPSDTAKDASMKTHLLGAIELATKTLQQIKIQQDELTQEQNKLKYEEYVPPVNAKRNLESAQTRQNKLNEEITTWLAVRESDEYSDFISEIDELLELFEMSINEINYDDARLILKNIEALINSNKDIYEIYSEEHQAIKLDELKQQIRKTTARTSATTGTAGGGEEEEPTKRANLSYEEFVTNLNGESPINKLGQLVSWLRHNMRELPKNVNQLKNMLEKIGLQFEQTNSSRTKTYKIIAGENVGFFDPGKNDKNITDTQKLLGRLQKAYKQLIKNWKELT